jgi:hypothetical protein
MSTTISGVVTNGVVVPALPLPEGAHVEIHFQADGQHAVSPEAPLTPGELRRMSRKDRQAILATAAALAEADYRDDKDLTGFDAFSEEMNDDSH